MMRGSGAAPGGALSADPAATLSPRQLAVLVAYARAGDQRQAAYSIGLTLHMFKEHLTVAYRKLGATSALEAYRVMGWLQVPDLAA